MKWLARIRWPWVRRWRHEIVVERLRHAEDDRALGLQLLSERQSFSAGLQMILKDVSEAAAALARAADTEPRAFAQLWAERNSKWQAEFFDELAVCAEGWREQPGMQWAMISNDLTERARRLVVDLAGYAPEPVCDVELRDEAQGLVDDVYRLLNNDPPDEERVVDEVESRLERMIENSIDSLPLWRKRMRKEVPSEDRS